MLSLEHMKYNQMPIKLLMPVFTFAIILHFWQQYQTIKCIIAQYCYKCIIIVLLQIVAHNFHL